MKTTLCHMSFVVRFAQARVENRPTYCICYYVVMYIELVFLALVLTQVVILCGVVYMVCGCIKLKRSLSLLLNMDCEELLENLLAEPREQPLAGAEGTTANVRCFA